MLTLTVTEDQGFSLWLVPNRRIDYFVGREDMLRRIDEAFSALSICRIAVLQAMGGQGKSQTALEYCHRTRNTKYAAVFWVDASTESAVVGSLLSIFEEIKSSTDVFSDVKARVAFVLRKIASWPSKWLLIFDNYDDPRNFPHIKSYFPDGQKGAILVTSRHADTNELVLARPANFIEVPGLEEDAALELLMERSRQQSPDLDSAKFIVQRLGYHPLAITHAAAYIRKQVLRFSEFMNHFERRKEYILEKVPLISEYTKKLPGADRETALSVFTTWDLQLQQLQSQSDGDSIEVKVLTLLAFFDNNSISSIIFACYPEIQDMIKPITPWLDHFIKDGNEWDADIFKDVLLELKDLSLIQTCAPEGDEYHRVSLHPLIKDWIRFRTGLPTCQENTMITALLLRRVARMLDEKELFPAVSVRRLILPHANAMQQNLEKYLLSHSSENINRRALGGYIVAYRECVATSVHFLFSTIGDGVLMMEPLKALAQDTMGSEHPLTLSVLQSLTTFYSLAGRDEEVHSGEEVIEKRGNLSDMSRPDTLKPMLELAWSYCKRNQPAEAEKLLEEIQETGKEVLAPSDTTMMQARALLGELYMKQGRYQAGEELLTLALETGKISLGPDDSSTIYAILQLVKLFAKQERWDELKALELHWFTGVEASVVHPECYVLDCLAFIYSLQSRSQDVTRVLLRLFKERSNQLGAENFDTLQTSVSLAEVYHIQGDVDAACELLQKAISGFAKLLGGDHEMTTLVRQTLEEWTNVPIRTSDSDSNTCDGSRERRRGYLVQGQKRIPRSWYMTVPSKNNVDHGFQEPLMMRSARMKVDVGKLDGLSEDRSERHGDEIGVGSATTAAMQPVSDGESHRRASNQHSIAEKQTNEYEENR